MGFDALALAPFAARVTYLEDGDCGVVRPDGIDFGTTDRIVLLACGTAYYACYVASYWIEAQAHLPVEIEIASEYRFRDQPLSGREIVIAVSQCGETAVTLTAMTALSGRVAARIALVNVPTSSIALEAEAMLDLAAAPKSTWPRPRPLTRSSWRCWGSR